MVSSPTTHGRCYLGVVRPSGSPLQIRALFGPPLTLPGVPKRVSWAPNSASAAPLTTEADCPDRLRCCAIAL